MMDIILNIFIVAFWLLTGYTSFVFWWTREWDYTTLHRPLAIFSAMLGPLAYLSGFIVHRGWGPPRVRAFRNPFRKKVLVPCRFGPGWLETEEAKRFIAWKLGVENIDHFEVGDPPDEEE